MQWGVDLRFERADPAISCSQRDLLFKFHSIGLLSWRQLFEVVLYLFLFTLAIEVLVFDYTRHIAISDARKPVRESRRCIVSKCYSATATMSSMEAHHLLGELVEENTFLLKDFDVLKGGFLWGIMACA